MSNIRLNWVAILVAAIASFLFEALWFSVFMNEWLAGIVRHGVYRVEQANQGSSETLRTHIVAA